MERKYTARLTEKQIDILQLGLTMLRLHNQETIGMLAGKPEYSETVDRCIAETESADEIFSLLTRATYGR